MPGLGVWEHYPLPDRFSGIAGIPRTQWPIMRVSIILGSLQGQSWGCASGAGSTGGAWLSQLRTPGGQTHRDLVLPSEVGRLAQQLRLRHGEGTGCGADEHRVVESGVARCRWQEVPAL